MEISFAFNIETLANCIGFLGKMIWKALEVEGLCLVVTFLTKTVYLLHHDHNAEFISVLRRPTMGFREFMSGEKKGTRTLISQKQGNKDNVAEQETLNSSIFILGYKSERSDMFRGGGGGGAGGNHLGALACDGTFIGIYQNTQLICIVFSSSNNTELNEPRHEKTCLREFPTRSDSNWPAQLQKLAGGLKFWLQKLETLHYLGSEQQRR